MKNILIAGARSYIGEAFRAYMGQWPGEYRVSVLDMRAQRPGPELFREADAVLCVTGIAHIRETNRDRQEYFRVNRDLVTEIAKAAKAAGVRQFILLSSMSVYGRETGRITKETVPAPVNAYGQSKLEADERIRALEDEGFRFTCLRPPMVYGKNCRGNYQRLRSFALKAPFFPDHRNQRSMVYIGNLCDFIKDCVDEERRGLFFPQNAEYTNTSEMVRQIAAAHGKRIRLTRAFRRAVELVPFGVVKKVFGDLVYEPVDTVAKYGLQESIEITEGEQHG